MRLCLYWPPFYSKYFWPTDVSSIIPFIEDKIHPFTRRFLSKKIFIEDFNEIHDTFLRKIVSSDYKGISDICDKKLSDFISCNIKTITKEGLKFGIERIGNIPPEIQILDFKICKESNIGDKMSFERMSPDKENLHKSVLYKDHSISNLKNIFLHTLKI